MSSIYDVYAVCLFFEVYFGDMNLFVSKWWPLYVCLLWKSVFVPLLISKGGHCDRVTFFHYRCRFFFVFVTERSKILEYLGFVFFGLLLEIHLCKFIQPLLFVIPLLFKFTVRQLIVLFGNVWSAFGLFTNFDGLHMWIHRIHFCRLPPHGWFFWPVS